MTRVFLSLLLSLTVASTAVASTAVASTAVASAAVASTAVATPQPDSSQAIQDTLLADQAEVILVGRVLDINETVVDSPATTVVSVAVETLLKGQLLHSPVLLQIPSGRIESPANSRALGSSLFSRGQRALLFLETATAEANTGEPTALSLVHGSHGAFHTFHFGDSDVAYHDFWESDILAPWEPAGMPHEKLRDLTRFSHWLSQRAQGSELAIDYWLDADTADLRRATRSQVARGAIAAKADRPLKLVQGSATVTDPTGDVGPNQLGVPSPDLVSGQISGSGSNLSFVVRLNPSSFGADTREASRCYFWIDSDENSETGPVGLLGGERLIGTEYIITMSSNNVFALEFDPTAPPGTFPFQTVGTFPTTDLADGFLGFVPVELLGGDVQFAFKVHCHVQVPGRPNILLDAMPNITLPPSLARLTFVPAPAAPTNLQATAISQDRIDLSWNDTSDNEDLFEVERRVGGGSFQRIANLGADSTTFQDTGVAPGETYTYRVRASNEAGASDFSNNASATVPGGLAPSDLSAFANSTSEIQLTWTDNSTDETGFEVEMKAQGESFDLIQTLSADSESTTVAGLAEATAYTFRVRATRDEGNSSFSNEASASTFSGQTEPCVAGPNTLCLKDNRFQVEVIWSDFGGGTGPATDAGLVSPDSGLFYFFSPDNWEMLVKVLDGCDITNHFWVFAAATTDVAYTLQVTDTLTGIVKTYDNPLGTASPAITDTNAFATCAVQTPPGLGVEPADKTVETSSGLQSSIDPGFLKQGTCVADATTLCLNQGRFRAEIDWVTPDATGVGTVDAFQSADSGLFWFFSAENLEVLVKVLDACAFNDRTWVFAAATTDIEYTLTVTDTVTGEQKQYFNAAGNAAEAVTDTDAFASCS